MLERLTIDTQLETKERDPDAGIHREPTVLSSDHVGGRSGVEEPLHAEPTHDTTAQLLGERGQIGLGDRAGRQERRRPVTGRHEDAVGRWRKASNTVRPHSSLGYRPPAPESRRPCPLGSATPHQADRGDPLASLPW